MKEKMSLIYRIWDNWLFINYLLQKWKKTSPLPSAWTSSWTLKYCWLETRVPAKLPSSLGSSKMPSNKKTDSPSVFNFTPKLSSALTEPKWLFKFGTQYDFSLVEAGQNSKSSIARSFYHLASCVFILYDSPVDMEKKIDKWIYEVNEEAEEIVRIVLVRTKID